VHIHIFICTLTCISTMYLCVIHIEKEIEIHNSFLIQQKSIVLYFPGSQVNTWGSPALTCIHLHYHYEIDSVGHIIHMTGSSFHFAYMCIIWLSCQSFHGLVSKWPCASICIKIFIDLCYSTNVIAITTYHSQTRPKQIKCMNE
jgi:hypothetical protein